MTKANKPDQVVDITHLFDGAGLAPQNSTSISEGPSRRPMGQRHILFPDPLGILSKLTDGVVHDPLKKVFANVLGTYPGRKKK